MEKMRPIYINTNIFEKSIISSDKNMFGKDWWTQKRGLQNTKNTKRQQSEEFGEKVSKISYKKWSQEAEAFHSACA